MPASQTLVRNPSLRKYRGFVAVRPEERAGSVETAAAGTAPRGEIEGIPVRVVVVDST